MTSIFSRIIAGDIPSYKVFEDDIVYAFLDIHPMHLGHLIVVPKEEIGSVLDLPDDIYVHLMLTAKNTLGPALHRATKCARVGYAIEGFGVPDHMHLHLIPLFQDGDFDPGNAHTESPENMQIIAEKIIAEII